MTTSDMAFIIHKYPSHVCISFVASNWQKIILSPPEPDRPVITTTMPPASVTPLSARCSSGDNFNVNYVVPMSMMAFYLLMNSTYRAKISHLCDNYDGINLYDLLQ